MAALTPRRCTRLGALLVLTVAAAGCAGGGDGSSATATPVPTAQPQAESHHRRHHHHHADHSAMRTPSPQAAAPSAGGSSAACDNAGFLADRNAFASGSLNGDQFVDVCGTVTSVLPQRKTRSGNHGYFNVQLSAGNQIEIVSNLDAMAEASSNKPPATWPWVTTGQYVYVQGRYYYDNPTRQGIDWTEDDTSGSWPHVGYVIVCASPGNRCSKYW